MAALAHLPVELIERVVTLISMEDAGNLRLASRELCSKASQGSYLEHFIHHNVNLSEKSLRLLGSILSEDNLSRRLKHLTITGLVFDDNSDKHGFPSSPPFWDPQLLSYASKTTCTSEIKGQAVLQERKLERQRQANVILRRAQHEVNVECEVYPNLLHQALAQVKQHCGKDGLVSLRLDFKVDTGEPVCVELADKDARINNLSAHASYLFSITMDALLATRLSVHSLDIFSKTRHCSLASTQLSPYLDRTSTVALGSLTGTVRKLALSFSRVADSEARRPRDMCCACNERTTRRTDDKTMCHKHRAYFEDEDDAHCQSEHSLAAFLKLFTNLQELDLHQYEIEPSGDKWNPVAFEQVADTVRLQNLTKLSLRGVSADEPSMMAFLATHKHTRELDLRHINLKDGQWQPIFSYIKTGMPRLSMLTLEDLFENKRADTVTVPLHNTHIINIVPPPPPPPPIVHVPFGGMPPPPPPNTSQVDTYLNTLLTFKMMNIPDEEFTNYGLFKTNKVKINSAWVAKADILYGFVSHAASKWKLERKWMQEQAREYGPPPNDLWTVDW